MHDELTALARHHSEGGEEAFARTLESFARTVEDTLERNGFEPYSVESDDFDGSRQRADKAVSSAQVGLDGRVEARTGKGFAYGGKVFRPERVTVYRFRADTVFTAPAGGQIETRAATDGAGQEPARSERGSGSGE